MEIVGMRQRLGAVGIRTHVLGGGPPRDIEDLAVDGEWSPDMTSGLRCVESNR